MSIWHEQRHLAADEVAEGLGVSRRTVITWARHGLIPSVRIGRTIRFREDDLRRFLRGSSEVSTRRAACPDG